MKKIPLPKPALLIAGPRTGGTFLCTALSNHPRIFCPRGEPFHRRSSWSRKISSWKLRFDLLLEQQFYDISMCKININQVVELGEELWKVIQAHEPPIKILFLERNDELAQAISIILIKLNVRGHEVHTFNEALPEPVTLDPARVVRAMKTLEEMKSPLKARLRASGLPLLELTYEEMTHGQEVTEISEDCGRRICQFLEVPYTPLRASLRKVHRNLEQTILNWDEVKRWRFMQQQTN